MKIKASLVALLICLSASAGQKSDSYPSIKWHDSIRDIYIDNELDRSAQFLTTDNPSRVALLSAKFDKAIILDIESRLLFSTPKDAFKFSADRNDATSSSPFTKLGKFTRVDGPIYSFAVEGKPVLVRSHTGKVGEMDFEKLWETVPVWKASMENYAPDAAVVASLKAIDKDANLTLYFGTWCGDSKTHIPRLLKALQSAGNSKLHVKLVGVDNQFREPVDTVQPRMLTNVPTVIVEREGHELGRLVETPATKSLEGDLADLLQGKPPVHNGRWERGSLIAKGSYSYRDRSGKERGTESWELFNASEGGYFLHSRIDSGGMQTEVFHRVDTNRRPAFAEVTRTQGDNRTRVRFTIDKDTMTARVRGKASGVITQTIEVPKQFFLSSPAIASQGWSQSLDATGRTETVAYLEPSEFESPLGTLAAASSEAKGEETLRVPAGVFKARHFLRNAGRENSEWWIDSQLGVPVRGRIGNLECVLTSLTVSSTEKQ